MISLGMVISILVALLVLLTIYLGIKIVPQSKVYVIERFGKYYRTLNAGLSIIIPYLDTVAHRIDILERQLESQKISVITRDNVEVELETSVFYRVVDAGKSDIAQALKGRMVGVFGGGMYTQYRCLNVNQCLPLVEGTTAEQGASCFVNPMTALGMVETMRMEGHTALVHTAAASNLGQMLNQVCLSDGIGLTNIVRSSEQVAMLKEQGSVYTIDSSQENFQEELTKVITETGATLGFDAVGGGKLAGQILNCMEMSELSKMADYSAYGSDIYKQIYIYGGLDMSPTTLNRSFGLSWGVGGWLLMPFMMRAGQEIVSKMKKRVATELTTTFASSYASKVSLAEALSLDTIIQSSKRATGEKILITPQK